MKLQNVGGAKSLNTTIDQMSPDQARRTLDQLNAAFAGKSGRIVFQRDSEGNLTGASRDRGLWSGIKAVFSSSYRERLQATESDFGALIARASRANVDGGMAINNIRAARRREENAAPTVSILKKQGLFEPSGVKGQLTPGLMKFAAQRFDFLNSSLGDHQLTEEQWRELAPSNNDQGGHGGTMKGPLKLNGSTQNLFLKPFDGVEAKNYELISKMADGKLDAFLPKIHGRTTDSKGNEYLMMENTLHDKKQFGDVKIAGKVDGLENPIADQDEMVFTRGKTKGAFDFWQMKRGAEKAPNFMYAEDGALLGKKGRFFNYQNSEGLLHNKLSKAEGLTAEKLKDLAGKINKLKQALSESPVALIGGSVMIIQEPIVTDAAGNQQGGELRPMLIDPAHVQYDPDMEKKFGDCGAFYGTESNYKLRKNSNEIGLDALEQSIRKLADTMPL